MARGKLSDGQKLDLIRKYTDGAMLSNLAREFGISYQAAHEFLDRRDILVRKQIVRLTDEDKKSITALRRTGVSCEMIAKSFGMSIGHVSAVAIQGGCPREKRRISEETRRAIVGGALAGLGADELSVTYGRSSSVIKSVLRRNGAVSYGRRVHALDESVFDDAENSCSAAYWVGFLFGDGNVTDFGVVRIQLSGTDRCHVEKFRDFLGTTAPISVIPASSSVMGDGRRVSRHEMLSLSACSVRLASALSRYGVVPRKTHVAKAVGLEQSPCFWRGLVDADGTICLLRSSGHLYVDLSAVGSEALMGQFSAFIRKISPGCKATVRKHKTIWRVATAGRHAYAVIKCLYGGGGPALDRKMARANYALANCSPESGRLLTGGGWPDRLS